MARELDLSKPLSAKDVAYLRSRHHDSYVERMIELAGGLETDEGTEDAQLGTEDAEGSENGGEDLIGVYDPNVHTADEVVEYLKTASDEEKARIIALETDGKGRVTILNA